MDIQKAIHYKKELEQDIKKLLQNYCEETGLKFGKIEISSFYDIETIKGKYNIQLNVKNPF